VIPTFEPIFRNPHLLTIAGNFWPREIDEARFPPTRRLYQVDTANTILVKEHQPLNAPRGQIIFLHGLEGSDEAGYIQSFAQAALERGFGVHRKNMRTCGGTEDLCATMYHSGLTADTRFIAEDLRKRFGEPVFVVGFSLGGNVALKLAGELDETDLLAGVCSISTPIDLARCVRQLDKPENFLYARRFLSRLQARVRRKNQLSPETYSLDGLDTVRGIWEFDDKFTAPLFGFGTAENYYRTQSSQNFLDRIRIPTLVIAAKDDPLVPFAMYEEHPAFRNNPALQLIPPEFGGHLGFLSKHRPRFWLDGIALDFLERVPAAHASAAERSV
jgi:predicted alpha/beta-fold hydrolase